LANAHILDQSLWVEVQCYRSYQQQYDDLKKQLKALEDQQFIIRHQAHKSVWRLEMANTLKRIKDLEILVLKMVPIIPWVFERGHST
jgi:hypothetical protein